MAHIEHHEEGHQAFEKLFRKQSEDASQKLSWYQMSLQIYQGHRTPSAQFRQ